MEVLTLLLFIGAFWVLAALSFFAWTQFNASDEHADRLALLPLEDNWHDPGTDAADANRIKLKTKERGSSR